MEALKAVLFLSFRLLLRSRKTLVMALLAMAPVVAALLAVVIVRLQTGPAPATGFGILTELASIGYIQILLLALPLFYGTSLIGDEVEERTITYLFVRPVPRAIIFVGKYLACVLTVVVLVFPSFLLAFSILSSLDPAGEVIRHLPVLFQDLGILLLGILAYCSLFGLFGAIMKRPLLWGLVFALLWEGIVTYIPGYVHRLTIAHYLQSLVPHASGQRGVLQIFGETTSAPIAILTLLVIAGAFAALASWTVSRRQYVLPA